MHLMPDTLAAAVSFPGAVTAALLHTLPNINNSTTRCLPPPTLLSSTKHKQAVLSQLLCMCLARLFCLPTGQKSRVEMQGEPREGFRLPFRQFQKVLPAPYLPQLLQGDQFVQSYSG